MCHHFISERVRGGLTEKTTCLLPFPLFGSFFTMFLVAMFPGTRTQFLAFARPAGRERPEAALGLASA